MEVLAPGGSTLVKVEWDGNGLLGQPLPAGMYFIIARTAHGTVHGKLLKIE